MGFDIRIENSCVKKGALIRAPGMMNLEGVEPKTQGAIL